ncbi:uncharacterized protein LOC114828087 [Galendromus occidentalis]|uniref:Uncharacterized protein LOC114828087 n=1 Tax=Galendromus occidentalis TaxID=34638 RepID=A0AAJ7SDB4_9ACAR|nr:uncharacterized protein LOC114828087 [Galendromus occidentalis]
MGGNSMEPPFARDSTIVPISDGFAFDPTHGNRLDLEPWSRTRRPLTQWFVEEASPSVITTPPHRSVRPSSLCLDFPTPPSEFLSSDSPRRQRSRVPWHIGGEISSKRKKKLDSVLSFRSDDQSSGVSQGTPLVWSANSRRCSRDLLEVPNQRIGCDQDFTDLDLWRAQSAEVIGGVQNLHMDELAQIVRNKNMVRRRSADLLEDCLRRHTRSLSEVDNLQMVGMVTANQIVSKRRWRRMVLRERAVDAFALTCGGTCCIACLYACVAYFFLPGTWPTVFGPCEDALCALK